MEWWILLPSLIIIAASNLLSFYAGSKLTKGEPFVTPKEKDLDIGHSPDFMGTEPFVDELEEEYGE